MKVTRRWRAVQPEGVAPAFPDEPDKFPTWSEEQGFTEKIARENRDDFYPGWTLEVEVTTVHDFFPVDEDPWPAPGSPADLSVPPFERVSDIDFEEWEE